MSGEQVPDPIAERLLMFGKDDIENVSRFLADQGIRNPKPLKEGYGTFAVVLDAGDKVVRLSLSTPAPRVDAPFVLHPEVEEKIGNIWVQVTTKVDTTGITEQDVQDIQSSLSAKGYHWDDAGTDNLGRDAQGSLVIIDGTVSENSR